MAKVNSTPKGRTYIAGQERFDKPRPQVYILLDPVQESHSHLYQSPVPHPTSEYPVYDLAMYLSRHCKSISVVEEVDIFSSGQGYF